MEGWIGWWNGGTWQDFHHSVQFDDCTWEIRPVVNAPSAAAGIAAGNAHGRLAVVVPKGELQIQKRSATKIFNRVLRYLIAFNRLAGFAQI